MSSTRLVVLFCLASLTLAANGPWAPTAEQSIRHRLRPEGEAGESGQTADGSDFRADVEHWLMHALVLPPSASSRPGRRRPRRLRDEIP